MAQIASSETVSSTGGEEKRPHHHIVIVGTGFSGLGMAIKLKKRKYQDFIVLEKAADIGGTWRDNTYPGCACDIPSNLYSFSFALNPGWSHIYPSQSEIQRYLLHCAERFGITEHIRCQCEVLQANWQEDEQRWHLSTAQGPLTADILIAGQGPLAEPSLPAIPGIEHFAGTLFHSARWQHTYDLTGKRVAVIGTGASAIQFVPKIQAQVEHLTLFQRTPPWIMPRGDHEVTTRRQSLYRRLPFVQRLVRNRIYWRNEITALGFVHRPDMLKAGVRIAQRHLQAQVPDPDLRTRLTPNYTLGCKRVLVSDDFYPALNQPNVTVITDAIREIRAESVVTANGSTYEVDTLICGTGFHVTDTQFPRRIYGRDGRSLGEHWQEGPDAYRGTTVAGFPNLFLMIGPNTGLGHNSMIFMIEAQISYILDCLHTMEHRGMQTVEVRPESQEAFNRDIQQHMQHTVWASGCSSWYLDASGRNTTIWPGFTFTYWRQMRHFDTPQYQLRSRSATRMF